MSVAAYIRVSTTDQNEAGQRRDIERWLKGHGVEGVRWFIDRQTGDHLDRPAFIEMQAAVFAGEVKTIIVWKLDRLTRKLRDGINAICDWCDKGVRLVSVTQQIDFSGTVGKMIANVLFAVSELEQETRRERQASGIAAARERGVYQGRKPGTLKADASRAVKLRDKGNTIAEIAAAMSISPRTAARYLKLADAR